MQVGWVLLPLRAFIAFVYLYGGISKIADRRFLSGDSPTSMHASVLAVRGTSPIGGLLGPVADHSFAFGLPLAIGELAVGLGLALGLWTRLAALGGMILALSLWLTVSWGASPWFTSADLVYLFAFTPLLIAGAGGVLSLDGWLAGMARAHPGRGEDRTRRWFVTGGVVAGAMALLGVSSLFRRSTRTMSVARRTPSGAAADLVQAAAVPVGGAKQVKDPASGDPVWVLQLLAGHFTACDAICPHQGCTVDFVSARDGFSCPCHGSQFAVDGSRLSGPAPRGLATLPVALVDGSVRRT
jgi:thiosulfate dehydrogenase [quinone] large subunit